MTGAYPVLVLNGEQGSGKSTTHKMLCSLIDPRKEWGKGQPRNEHELGISAYNSWITTHDNLSWIPDWMSDVLCRVATGGAIAVRQLWTDSEEVILDFKRPALLNGIPDLATRADLLSRAIVLGLPP